LKKYEIKIYERYNQFSEEGMERFWGFAITGYNLKKFYLKNEISSD
jgi:hypothetical protein